MPYWDEPKYNEPDEIDGPDDVSLPSTMHHMQAKAELNVLVREGAITDDEAQDIMSRWRAKGDLGEDDRVEAAISVLHENGVIDDTEARDLKEKAAA